MKILYILRGIPGCGKSTLAEVLANGMDVICCADDYYINKYGYYKWNAAEIGFAHQYSQNKCKKLMENSADTIIVSNTNTTEKEMKPYMEMAKANGYMIFSLIVENRHGGVNEHNVPVETLEKMRNRFEIKL